MHQRLLLGLATLLASSAGPAFADDFTASCTLPFVHPAEPSVFDQNCGNTGTPETPAIGLEYVRKNDLCASGPITDIDFKDLKKLHDDATGLTDASGNSVITTGNRHVAVADRSVLGQMHLVNDQPIAEGDLVRLVGYVAVARPSGSMEGVNCSFDHSGIAALGGDMKDDQLTDIHINVSSSPTDQCQGVVVEIIPHRRPEDWTHAAVRKTLTPGITRQHPDPTSHAIVRVTGPLFFDSRHNVTLNDDGTCEDPQRMSLWEIHPVYQLDVCLNASISECRIGSDDDWKPLSDTMTAQSNLVLHVHRRVARQPKIK